MADKMTVDSNVFQLPISITSNGTVTKTLATQDKYLDKNIKVAISTPDASFERKTKAEGENGEISATVSTADTTYTTTTPTDYHFVIAADAHVNAVTVGTKEAGFTAATDTITIEGTDAEQDTQQIYLKAGALSGTGTASATGGNGVDLTSAGTTEPKSGYYIKAAAAGSVEVSTAGWLKKGETAEANGSDQYYTLPSVALANTETAGKTYSEKSTPVLTEGGYLYINEGYIEDTKISLATLVPDGTTLGTVTNASSYMYNTIKAYDNDGVLVTGTMGDAKLGEITASDAAAKITNITVTSNGDNFTVAGEKAISGSTSVSISERGLAETTLSQTGEISGKATVDTTLAKIGLGVETSVNDGVVTPVISKEEATTAHSGDITTSTPESGYYVAISTAAVKEDVTISAKVNSEGYGTTTDFSATDATLTAGANASGVYYVPIDSATHSVTKSESEISAPSTTVTTAVNGGDVTPVTYAESAKTEGVKYIKIAASATTEDGSVKTTAKCTSTEGYITAFANDIVTTETVEVADASAAPKYIMVYDGELLDEA